MHLLLFLFNFLQPNRRFFEDSPSQLKFGFTELLHVKIVFVFSFRMLVEVLITSILVYLIPSLLYTEFLPSCDPCIPYRIFF